MIVASKNRFVQTAGSLLGVLAIAALLAPAAALAGEGPPSHAAVEAFQHLQTDPQFKALKRNLPGNLDNARVVDNYLAYLPVPPKALHNAERWLTRSEMPMPRILEEWNHRWMSLHPKKAAKWAGEDDGSSGMSLGTLAATVGANENTASGTSPSPQEYQGEIQIVVNPADANEMVAAANTWDDMNGECGASGTQAVVYSSDGGASWGYTCAPDSADFVSAGIPDAPDCSALGGDDFGSDPALYYDAAGNVYLEYMLLCYTGDYYYSIVVSQSSDGGATWSPHGVIVNSYDTGTLEDKNFYAIDRSSGQSTSGNHYTCWDRGNDEKFAYSNDGGASWTEVDLPPGAGACPRKGRDSYLDLGCEMAVGSDGTVHIVWDTLTCGFQTCSCEEMSYAQSTDGGQTWSTPTTVQQFNLAGFSNDSCPDAQNERCISPFGAIDVDNSGGPRDGNLYVTFTDHTGGGADTSDVWMTKSTDDGASWGTPVRINDDGEGGNIQFHPFLVVDQSNGDVVTAWHDARNDAGNAAVDYFAARSTDGATFEANVQVSAASSDFYNSGRSSSNQNSTDNPDYNPNQYGEYMGLDVQNGTAYLAWSDTRQYYPLDPGDGEQENIGFATVAFDSGTTNSPPTASFTYSCTDLTCDFDASGSSDSDGTISSYDWDFGDGNTGTGVTASHTYGASGDYTVTLTVTDDGGATDSTSQVVSVSDGTNSPPTASFTYSCTDLACDFDGTGSSDSDGTISSYAWDFGDGNTGTGSTVSHTYGAGGDYTVTLTVTDDGGATDSTSQTVSVSASSGITLSATGYKVRGRHNIDLTWSGATSTNVDVYRDGALLTTTANDGAYTDSTNNRGGGSYTYQVCEAGTSTCSNETTVTF